MDRSIFPMIVLYIMFIPIMDMKKFRCDYTYFVRGNVWMKFHDQLVNWNKAESICNSEDSDLATPVFSDIKIAMETLLSNYTNVTAVHTALVFSIPYHKTNHYIIKYVTNNNAWIMKRNGEFIRQSKSSMYPFICERKSTDIVNEDLKRCGEDKAYYLDYRTGNCYKLHTTPSTFQRAQVTCRTEDAGMVVINNQTEADVVVDRLALHYNDDETVHNWVFVGVQMTKIFNAYHMVEYQWMTEDGKHLFELGYEKWDERQPDNATKDESCLAVTRRTGLLRDESCVSKAPFLCEKIIIHNYRCEHHERGFYALLEKQGN